MAAVAAAVTVFIVSGLQTNTIDALMVSDAVTSLYHYFLKRCEDTTHEQFRPRCGEGSSTIIFWLECNNATQWREKKSEKAFLLRHPSPDTWISKFGRSIALLTQILLSFSNVKESYIMVF